jgi:hypothetical protein
MLFSSQLSKKTGNVRTDLTLRRVRLTNFAVEINYYIFWVCVYSLIYPASKARALYCIVMYAVFRYTILFHITSHTARFSKKCNYPWNVCFDFLYILSAKFLILRITQRDITTNVHRSSCQMAAILVRYQWNLDFFERFSEIHSNVRLCENPVSGRRVVPCKRTDRQIRS